jgi:uncharacterized membrane protein (UPF0127 family)
MQSKTKIKILIAVIVLVVLAILINYVFSEVVSTQWNPIKHVYVRDILVKAEAVQSEEKIEKGLAERASLEKGRGMLFEMPEDDVQRFWMKGMQFAIDIIWIENGRVTGCEKNIQPSDSRIFVSPTYAGHVLEVSAGFCDENGIKVNDEVKM